MTHLLLSGGSVIDGTGAPAREGRRPHPRRTDRRDRPAPRRRGRAGGRTSGAYVTPGFIDCHTHFDASVFWDPRCDPMPEHGVTTVLIGNCSLGLAPTRAQGQAEISDIFSICNPYGHQE